MRFQKTTLKNGLRLITAPMKETNTATVVVAVGAGSKYENKSNNGISHFLEHMFFKGTKKRPKTKDISEALDSVGGEFNAFTGKERTVYYVKVDAAHLDLALDIVSDIYLNSKLEQKEINKEQGVIIQEINMYQDTPMVYVGDVFEKLLYGDQPAGWEIIGTKENVSRFRRRDFTNYLRDFYTAPNTVVCAAGNLKHDRVFGKVKKLFSRASKARSKGKAKVLEKQFVPKVKIKFKKTDQTHLVLGARAYNMFHPDRYALSLLSNILGESMSSRLFLSVRERQGLAYYINSSYESYTDSGYLAVKAGVDTDCEKIKKTVKIILNEFRKMRDRKVSARELKKAKDNIRGKMAMSLESSDEVASYLVNQELMRREILTPDKVLREFDKVGADDIMRVAGDIFMNSKLNLALIGPIENGELLEKILKI